MRSSHGYIYAASVRVVVKDGMENTRYFTIPGSDRTYDRNKLLVVLIVALVMSLIQVSSVNNLLPIIETGLNAGRGDIQWVLSGYSLAFGLLLVPAGRLGDIFGRSSLWMIGMAVFTLGSLLCGVASDALILNIARALQGIGSGIFSPQVTGMIMQYFDGHARAKAFAYMGLAVSASVAVGPLLSGSLVQIFGPVGWRWSFILNVPLGLLGLGLGIFLLPFLKERRAIGDDAAKIDAAYRAEMERRGQPVGRRRGHHLDLDPVGMTLLALAVLCLMLPFMSHFAWRWALLGGGALLGLAWVLWEHSYAKRGRIPMVNLRLFRIESFSFCTSITAIQFLGTTSVFVVLAMYLQQGMGFNALQAGMLGLPNAIASAYASVWAGRYAVAWGRHIQAGAFALALVSLASSIPLAAGIAYSGWSPWWLSLPICVFGFGIGVIGSANQTQAMIDVPRAHGGTAGGVQQTSQRITTAIGNAMVTAILFAFVNEGTPRGDGAWFTGYAASMGTICFIVALALTVSIIFMRRPASPAMLRAREAK